ncbi:PREDICTED: retinoic acid early transcript 1L protein-like [Chinchilla lanigera]|uniref:retinoic acid early transcript 1L protein-like n=1 Tax=Chinchilla lanigera TaxID=34839 RepID=UPI000696394C|nr:PREDICTED: retinoic acid early transcript 1L protein-like [Chinchilla lanigera]
MLQAIMTCHQRAGRHFSGAWQFQCNGQTSFHVDWNQRKWTEVSPGSRCMKKWKNDRELCLFLYRTSMEDCGTWLSLWNTGRKVSRPEHQPPPQL